MEDFCQDTCTYKHTAHIVNSHVLNFIYLFMLLVSSKNAISSFHNALQAGNIPLPQDHCIYFCILMNAVCSQTNCLLIIFFLKVMSFPQGPLQQGTVNGPASLFNVVRLGPPASSVIFFQTLLESSFITVWLFLISLCPILSTLFSLQ